MHKIALIGLKGIGKDYFFSSFSEYFDSKRYAIGDVLKIESFGFHGDWEHNNYLNDDFLLLKDLLKSNNGEISLLPNQIEFLESITDVALLDDYQKLKLSEITKNIGLCKSRYCMNSFGTYVRQKTGNNSYFLDRLFEKINEERYNDGYLFVNDSRYITELLDFLINDFFIVKFENASLYDSLISKNGALHPTEAELSCYPHNIGLTLNMEGSLDILSIKRRTPLEMSELVFKIVDTLKSFNGYSDTDKLLLTDLKNKFNNDSLYKQLVHQYVLGLESKPIDFDSIKQSYYTHIYTYVDQINDIINKYYK